MNKRTRNVPRTPPVVNQTAGASAVSQAFPQQQQIQVAQQVTTIFDPEVLRKYSTMVPDAPERVLKVFEKNSESERNIRDAMADQQRKLADIQEMALSHQAQDNRRRDWMAFSLMCVGVGASIYFAVNGKDLAAGSAFLASLAVPVGYFLARSSKKNSDRE
jgi:uncharacterized membrane protein